MYNKQLIRPQSPARITVLNIPNQATVKTRASNQTVEIACNQREKEGEV